MTIDLLRPTVLSLSTSICIHVYVSALLVSFTMLGSLAAALRAVLCPYTFSLPLVFYFTYVYCFTVLNSPRICVCSMNRIALVASLRSFKIALRSSRPILEVPCVENPSLIAFAMSLVSCKSVVAALLASAASWVIMRTSWLITTAY